MSLLLGLTLLAAGCGGTPPAPAAAAPTPVAIAAVEAGDVPSTFEAGGIVRARTTAAIASRLLAPVVAVHVRAGDRVRRGAALVVLEGSELAAAQARARAAASASDESVRAAEGSTQAATAALTLARATHRRVLALYEKRSATAQEMDQATAALDAATAQLASAQAGAAGAAASKAAAGEAARAASAALGYTVLAAPFDGVVTERSVDPGDMAAPGTRLLAVDADGPLRLEVPIDEARAALVSRGQTVDVALGDAADAPWIAATVGEIARVDPASHSFLVRLDLPAGTQARSGSFGRARFPGVRRAGLSIPGGAIVRRGQLTFVYVPSGGVARLQPISVGAALGDRLEVLAGLAARDRVVLQPPPALADGAAIVERSR